MYKIDSGKTFEKIGKNTEKNYIIFGNGLVIQWGIQTKSTSVSGGSNSNGAAISFPIEFASIPAITITHISGNQFNMTATSVSKTGFTPVYRNVNTNTAATTTGCHWIAIGYTEDAY